MSGEKKNTRKRVKKKKSRKIQNPDITQNQKSDFFFSEISEMKTKLCMDKNL